MPDLRVVWDALQREQILTKMLGTPEQPHVTLENFQEAIARPDTVLRWLAGADGEPEVLIILQEVVPDYTAIGHIGARRRAWGDRVAKFTELVMAELFDPGGAYRLRGLIATPCWTLGTRFAERMGFVVHPTGALILPADRFAERKGVWAGSV